MALAEIEIGVKVLSKRLPKVLSPRAHAMIEYGVAGAFFIMGAAMWGSSKRAAIASLACGAAETAIILLTDYPGGVAQVISFETHGRIDAGMAGTLSLIPTILGFSDQEKSAFFRIQSLGIAATTAMTDFSAMEPRYRRRAA
jgi:hypothetical protein